MAKSFKTIEAVEPAILEEAAKDYPEPVILAAPHERAHITKEYLFGGNAHFTVKNPQNESFTYAVRAREGKGRYAGQLTYFLRVRSSGARFPYRYVGIAKPDGVLVPAGRSEFLPGSKQFDVASWAVKIVVDGSALPVGYSINHDGTCGKCNHTLTSDEDRARGFDELCWKAIHEGTQSE